MIQQIILTPFSYKRESYSIFNDQNPLNPKLLEHRLMMFKMITVPSLMAQKEKNFTWIIIIDKKLRKKYREKLLQITSGINNVFLYEYPGRKVLNSTKWMKPFIYENTKYLITSRLDGDDAIFKNFTHQIQVEVKELISKSIRFGIFSTDETLQWDFFFSSKAPFGYFKPWTRKNSAIAHSTMSVFAKYPDFESNVMLFRHAKLVAFLKSTESEKGLESTKEIFTNQHIDKNAQMFLSKIDLKKHIFRINEPGKHVIVTNHLGNVRYSRITEYPETRTPVEAKETLKSFGIDFWLVEQYIKKFRKQRILLAKMIFKALFYKDKTKVKRKSKNWTGLDIKGLRIIHEGYKNMN